MWCIFGGGGPLSLSYLLYFECNTSFMMSLLKVPYKFIQIVINILAKTICYCNSSMDDDYRKMTLEYQFVTIINILKYLSILLYMVLRKQGLFCVHFQNFFWENNTNLCWRWIKTRLYNYEKNYLNVCS